MDRAGDRDGIRSDRRFFDAALGDRVLLVFERRLSRGHRGEPRAIELDDDDRDVVVAAGLVRFLRQHFACLERIGDGEQRLTNVFGTDHSAEAVGAKQERVAAPDVHEREIYLDRFGGSESLKDDVVVLERFGFFFGELPGFDELVHQRLVARDLDELIAAQNVRAAVPDLGDEEPRVEQRRDRGGRPHAAPGAVGARLVEDAETGLFDRAH
jgi:hypothetical protein